MGQGTNYINSNTQFLVPDKSQNSQALPTFSKRYKSIQDRYTAILRGFLYMIYLYSSILRGGD